MLAYTEQHPDTGEDIGLLRPGRDPVAFLRTPAHESGPKFSPGGNWIAFHSEESGEWEVYIARVPEDLDAHDPTAPLARYRVSSNCGGWPSWSPDGTRIYYRNCGTPDSFWAVDVDTDGPDPNPGIPVELFAGDFVRMRRGPSVQVTPDDGLLLASLSANTTRLELWQGWEQELRERTGSSGQ